MFKNVVFTLSGDSGFLHAVAAVVHVLASPVPQWSVQRRMGP